MSCLGLGEEEEEWDTLGRVGWISRDPSGRFVLVDSAESTVSSDDGGFLSRPGFRNVASWRRPLVGYPSDLSLTAGISTVYLGANPNFRSSSPESSVFPAASPILNIPYFPDLSSVRQDAERSLRCVHARYSQELPSLTAIQEAERGRVRGRYVPRHARSAPDLFTETSPESRSSSSGFGSKNTSSQPGALTYHRVPALPPPPPLYLPTSPTPPSVDDQYEFDVFPASPSPPDDSPTFTTKYDNIEARVQAMMEEFQAFKARQARLRHFDSAC